MSPVFGSVFLCLISIQEINKHKFHLIFNKKSILKTKTSKNIFYLKIKLNQVSAIALPDWQLLRQASENAILRPIISGYLESYSILTS